MTPVLSNIGEEFLELMHMGGGALLCLGGFFLLTGAVGLWRMPDFFTRLHPAGVADSLGLPLVLLGVAFLSPVGFLTVKILLLLLFAVLTGATACHALAKAALLGGETPVGIKGKKLVTRRTGRKKG